MERKCYWLIELVGKHLLVSLSVITLLVFVLVVNIQMISYCKLMMTQTSCQMSYFNIFYSILWHSCQSPVTHTHSHSHKILSQDSPSTEFVKPDEFINNQINLHNNKLESLKVTNSDQCQRAPDVRGIIMWEKSQCQRENHVISESNIVIS